MGELTILLFVSSLLLVFYLKPGFLANLKLPNEGKALTFILSLIMVINISLVVARLGDASQTNWQFYSATNRVLAAFALILSFSFFLRNLPSLIKKYRLIFIILIAALIRIFSIVSAPNPTIDVFYILRDGPKQLLEGKNPYQMSYPAPYGVYIPTIVFVYGPLTPFVFLPSVYLFNDPRYTLVAADLLTAYLIFKLAQRLKVKENIAKMIIVIFLFHPLFPFMTEQAWLEPVMTTFLFSATYFLLANYKNVASSLMLGFILAIKSVYLLPVLAYLKNSRTKTINYLIALALPVILSLPFLIASPELFLERTQTYVSDPGAIQANLAPTNVSLSIAAVILKYTHQVLPTALVVVIGIIVTLVVIFWGKKSLPFALLSMFFVFMTLFMFGPFVFLHYFAFLGNILLLVLLVFSTRNQKVLRMSP